MPLVEYRFPAYRLDLAQASQALAQGDYHALRSYAGTAPITRQSGKKKVVLMRRSCNPRLRDALHYWSRVSAQRDDRSKENYAELRRVGHSMDVLCAAW